MNKKYLIPLFLFFSIILKGQVGIGTTSPAVSAVLDIQSSSNDKGILIPRMTQAQRNGIVSLCFGPIGIVYFNKRFSTHLAVDL
tara:strand:- start:181 stop:432 length:252 start_codon:yes stop_codon:yes gene_type:complete